MNQINESKDIATNETFDANQLIIGLRTDQSGMYEKIMQFINKSSPSSETFDWIHSEAQSCRIALRVAAMLYEWGPTDHRNVERAFEYYEMYADQGNDQDMFELGYRYRCYPHANDCKAFEWLSRSAGLGNANACCMMGVMYEEGLGCLQSYRKAFDYYHESADRGNAYASDKLARMYANGVGVERDADQMIHYLRQSIESSHAIDPNANHPNANDRYCLDRFVQMIPNRELVAMLLEKLHRANMDLDELRIMAPIEGGDLYREALERFNRHKEKKLLINHANDTNESSDDTNKDDAFV